MTSSLPDLTSLGRSEAEAALGEALALRTEKGDTALVDSTLRALAWARGEQPTT